MAAAGLYTIGGSFWEFGEPDWERTKYFLMFGVAEDHDSNPIKIGLGKLKARGAKFVSVNPVRTGYSAIADEWIGIRPGTDGLFVLALVHELLRADRIDLDFLVRYTNAAWLVIDSAGRAPMTGCSRATPTAEPLVWDRTAEAAERRRHAGDRAARRGRIHACPTGAARVPVFQLLAERYLDARYAPEAVARTLRHPGRRRSAASPPNSPTSRSSRRSSSISPGPTAAGRRHEKMRRPAGGDARDARHLRPLQRLPDLPRASTCCRCCWARSMRPAVLALQVALSRSRSRRRRSPAGKRQSKPSTPLPGCRSASRTGRRICCSTTTARRCASTRPSPGRRRSPRTA